MKIIPEQDLSTVTWHKSSYSGGEGGNCLEMGSWRKSTYSGGNGSCLEVADTAPPGLVPVRDSKDPDGPALVFQAPAWSAFISNIKTVG